MPQNLLATVATVARGLLAEPTGDADRPYRRVIMQSLPAAGALTQAGPLPPLHFELTDGTGLRERLSGAIADYVRAHGAKPQAISLGSLGALRVAQAPRPSENPLENAVALVTGAAGAIGAGICEGLLQHGCRVAVTDLPGERLDRVVEEFRSFAPDRAEGIPMDVTDPESVRSAFEAAALRWGGVDIVVANAGIPLIASLVEMQLEDFRRLERVNAEGTLLTLAEAGRHLRLQGTGGDIVVVSTKNVFSPGARFGAYSATKAAAHQLGRIASIEMAEFGVRVNMVAPDAVFGDEKRRSGLWQQIGPDRMRHKGISENELEEYYRQRNLLKARITTKHVANAVLFFVTRQTPTTGATLPVDGGLPDATPR